MTLKPIGLLLAILVVIATGCAALTPVGKSDTRPDPIAIEGVYDVIGEGYRGAATVRRLGDTYLIQWRLRDISYSGIGIRDEDRLSASWFGINGEKGVVIYRITGGPRLEGRYALFPGRGGIRSEILQFKNPLPAVSGVADVL